MQLAVALALVALVLIWVAVRRQRRAAAARVARLIRAAEAADVAPADIDALDAPAPVVRYLRRAVTRDGRIRVVRIRQIGRLRTDVRRDRWMRFEADHVAAPPATGFVWNARVTVAPLVHVRVRDELIAGQGSGQVSLLSAVMISADEGTPQMGSGSLHRYLAEAVWYPTALLPGAKLRWSAIDASTARATLTDHGISVSLDFRFAESGEVAGIYTPERWGRFGGVYEKAPWEGHFWDYRVRDGFLVPTEGEVGWYVDGEWQAVWTGRVTHFEVLMGDPTGRLQ